MNYNTMKNILKIFNKVILILSIINICLSIQSDYINAETNNKIKVGYSIVSGFTEVENGVYSGFGFEYLREIAKYTGWEYEFIEMGLNDMINKLKDGEIDIAGAMFKNEETMELYDFPEYNSGATYTTLVTLKDNNSINISNYQTLEGIKVGYFETSNIKLQNFKNFCKANGFNNIELISYPYESGNEIEEALESGEVDAIITGDLLGDDEKKVIAKFGAIPYYFATKKGNTEIISGLNKAISKIKEKEPDYDQVLYNKYFKTFSSKVISLTEEEKEYINNMGVLKGIYVDNIIPVEYYNTKTKEADGIYVDLVNLIMERAGIKLELIKADTYEEAYNMLKNKEADLIIAVPDSYSIEKENDLFLTKSYLDVDMVEVKNKNIQTDKEIVALAKGYEYDGENEVKEFKYYETIEECLEAIAKGEATITNGSSYAILNYVSADYYSNLVVLYQEEKVNSSIGFAKPIDKSLINIINKAIDTISTDEVNNIIYDNMSNIHHKITLKQLFLENTILFIVIAIIIIIVIFTIIIHKFKELKKAKKLLLKKSQLDALTGMYNREAGEILVKEYLNTKPSNLYSAFAIVDIDYFKQVNDRLGHQIGDDVLKEFALVLKEVFAFKDIICRLGGDEFVVFMKDIEEVDIDVIRERLQILCKAMNKDIEYNNIKQEISLSVGCVITNKHTDFNELYKQADELLYKVKHNGKNGFKIKNDFRD